MNSSHGLKNPSFYTDFKNVYLALLTWDPKKSLVHFLNQYEETDFFIPHSPYMKKKSFLKGIVQPFELGGVTRLIRSAVKFRMAGN